MRRAWKSKEGVYVEVTFSLKNVGKLPAKNVRIHIIAKDQNNEVEMDRDFSIMSTLKSGETVTKDIKIDCEISPIGYGEFKIKKPQSIPTINIEPASQNQFLRAKSSYKFKLNFLLQ